LASWRWRPRSGWTGPLLGLAFDGGRKWIVFVFRPRKVCIRSWPAAAARMINAAGIASPAKLTVPIAWKGSRLAKRSRSSNEPIAAAARCAIPLNSRRPVEIDLCAEHIRALAGRRLGPHAFEQLRQQLYSLGLEVAQIFLLHEAFYDANGRALQPAVET
jgi:hypothetical protein